MSVEQLLDCAAMHPYLLQNAAESRERTGLFPLAKKVPKSRCWRGLNCYMYLTKMFLRGAEGLGCTPTCT